MNDDDLLNGYINEIIRDEIQDGINDYVDKTEDTKKNGLGFANDVGEKLNVKVNKSEVDKILKEYKKLKKKEKSNLGEIKKLNLLDQYGRQL